MLKKRLIVIGIIVCCILIVGCSDQAIINKNNPQEPVSEEIFAMDTYMSVTAYGNNAQDAVNEAIAQIQHLETLLSTGNENSEVSLLNQNGGGKLSPETKYLFEKSLALWQDTAGKFDITIYPIMQAWGFTNKKYVVPSSDTLSQLLTLVDSSAININEENSTVTFEKEGQKIDFGGIAKGYTSSLIMDIFRKHKVKKGLVNLGGNVQVLGKKSNDELWQVGIQDPDSSDYLGIYIAEDCAVITSGGYERFFKEDGVTYHHIIDPATGYPANGNLKSVTIVSEDGTLADGLSTSLFIMGKDLALDYWQKHGDDFNVILVDDHGVIYVSEALINNFTSEHEIQVIKR